MDPELDLDVEKDQPIICLMCKSGRKGDERFLMFGGNRPFMAKFEVKFLAFIGEVKFLNLKNKYKTKRDRSYICKHCYSIVNKTFDGIMKIQLGVARSVKRALPQDASTNNEHGCDLVVDYSSQVNLPKIKLPPVAERRAEKVASLTLVKINNTIPKVVLQPVFAKDFTQNFQTSRSSLHVKEQQMFPQSDFTDAPNCTIANSSGLYKYQVSHSHLSPAERAEILANPRLMVKSPQAVNLHDVKNANIYFCGENGCDWIFSSRFFWENHIRHYHYHGKPYKCPFDGCTRYFPTKSKLKQHVRKHTGEHPFVCEQCGKAFRGSQELRHHSGTHTVGKPYQCPKSNCYKSFKYMASMKRHLQYHDGNYPFPCLHPKCSKAFKNKYELKCHNRLHTGERPYKCKESGCGKAFRLPCEYTKHRRAHTGERPFKCTWDGCSSAYITCGGLASHMNSHTSDQHFCCEFCGKILKHRISYHAHLKKHTDPPYPFTCETERCNARLVATTIVKEPSDGCPH